MAETIFTFAEFNSQEDLDLLVKDVQRDIVGELSPQTIKIPARRGEVYEGSLIGSKNIVVSVLLKADTEEERIERAKKVAQLVQATADGELYPLKFNDEVGTTYWCYVAGISNPSRVLERSTDTEFEITFNVPEGVGYGEQISQIITTPELALIPDGTAPTYPVLTLDVGAAITKAGIATTDSFVYAGNEKEGYENTATSKRILNDPGTSISTWTKITTPTFSVENGTVTADAGMVSNGNGLEVTKKNGRYYYGTSTDRTKWQGPAYYQGLTKTVSNWKVTARFYTNNRYARSRSKIEVYLLDDVGTRIGKIMVKDNGIDLTSDIGVEIGLNSKTIVNKKRTIFSSLRHAKKITVKAKTTKKTITIKDKYKTTVKATKKKAGHKKGDTYSKKLSVESNNTENLFTDFYGIVTLEKKGNLYTATIQHFNSKGVATGKPYIQKFTDDKRIYESLMSRFSGVALYQANMPIAEDLGTTAATYSQNIVRLADLKVWDNDLDGTPPGETFEIGDEVIFDLENGAVYKNGELANFAIGSDFFSVEAGQLTNIGLIPEPSDKFVWTLDYIPRWL